MISNSSQCEITASPDFTAWLAAEKLSLAFTTYQTNRLFFIGYKSNQRFSIHERLFDKPMGLYAAENCLYMSSRYQIWRFDNALASREAYKECDRLYIPRTAQITGDLNVHDVVLDYQQQVIFVNTDFSCLATISPDYSFVPLWHPNFISKLVPEDRCHLNGLAMVEGKPAYVTACSATDTAAGWRNHRVDGGIVMDVAQNQIIASGLSMPHSPRWYQGKLWLLNSGTGELGYIEKNQFIPVTFCPGFVRGLAFWKDFAFVGLSKLRSNHFTGLKLENRLMEMGGTPQCGLMVINLKTGTPQHWLYFETVIEELFDVVVLPGVKQPQAIGLQEDEIQRLVTFPESQGIITTKPTVKRPSIGKTAPIAGLPQQVQGEPQPLSVKYQRVYHLNPSNALDYDDITYPSLQQRWQKQPPRGELLGISGSVEEALVGFAIAERINPETAEIISLLVLPQCRRQGIATKLLIYLEQELKQQGCQQLTLTYESTTMTKLALEPILQKLGWHPPTTIRVNYRQSYKSLSPQEKGSTDVTVERLESGGEFNRQNQFDLALERSTPKEALSRRGLAKTYELVGDDKTKKFRLARREGTPISEAAKSKFEAGKQLARQGNLEGAVANFLEALRLAPNYVAAYNQLGNAYQQLGQTEDAIAAYQQLLSINPNLAQAHCNLGAVWQVQGKVEEAVSAYQKAIELKPDLAVAYLNLGKLQNQQGEWEQAQQSLQEACRLQPNLAEAHYSLGNLLRQKGEIGSAIIALETALKHQPQFPEAWNSLGCVWMNQGEMEKAQGCFEKVIELNPNFAKIDYNLGQVLENQGKFTEALASYNGALEKAPDATEIFYQREHLRLILCDWEGYEQRMETLQKRLQSHLQDETAAPLAPLSINCFRVPPSNHLAVAQHWSKFVKRGIEPIKSNLDFAPPKPPSPKLRIGYLSADFRQHAMGTLIYDLFQYHDAEAFEIYAYSLHSKSDQFTAKIRDSVTHFRDFSTMSNLEAAQKINQDCIHILIDLTGYTTFSRPQIFALQPAPIQVQYLGYPNTMGADFIHYILADQWLIPKPLEGYYAEEVVRLPHAMVGSPLKMSDKPISRNEFGLPNDSFVFCCFNRTDKFDPEIFSTWMRILQRVPHSVLWLIENSKAVSQTLGYQAQQQGIDPERLIFTPRLPLEEYLKAYTLADLFLDTWVYNAGATAIHALWAGLPLITCPGQPFAARMGASICAAAGLEFLICDDLSAYEEKAVHLATNTDEFAKIRQKLQAHRDTLPLFQPQQWIADLEALCWEIWGEYQRE